MGKSSNVFRVPMPNIQDIDCPSLSSWFWVVEVLWLELWRADDILRVVKSLLQISTCKRLLLRAGVETSDLRMSTYVTYSPPLFQLSYRRVKSCIDSGAFFRKMSIYCLEKGKIFKSLQSPYAKHSGHWLPLPLQLILGRWGTLTRGVKGWWYFASH